MFYKRESWCLRGHIYAALVKEPGWNTHLTAELHCFSLGNFLPLGSQVRLLVPDIVEH